MTGVVAYRLNELAAGVAINVRPGQDDVADLVASIRAHGLLQPLVGRKRDDGKIEIIDGNRRLAALNQIDAQDDAADVATIEWVDVVLRDPEPDADAFEISLAANILRKPLHPVAEYEAFASLAERGKTNDDIAAHFGITLRQVEQRQALGRLHPDVRKAWLEGRINGDAARAFTLASPSDQAAYLAKGDLDAALNDFNAILQLNPNKVRAHAGRGQVFERTMALEMVDVPDGLVFAGEVCADTDGFVRLGLA